jgi:hypothetical protein
MRFLGPHKRLKSLAGGLRVLTIRPAVLPDGFAYVHPVLPTIAGRSTQIIDANEVPFDVRY